MSYMSHRLFRFSKLSTITFPFICSCKRDLFRRRIPAASIALAPLPAHPLQSPISRYLLRSICRCKCFVRPLMCVAGAENKKCQGILPGELLVWCSMAVYRECLITANTAADKICGAAGLPGGTYGGERPLMPHFRVLVINACFLRSC